MLLEIIVKESSCDSSFTHLLDVGIRSSLGNSQDLIQFSVCHDSSLAAGIEELMKPGAGKRWPKQPKTSSQINVWWLRGSDDEEEKASTQDRVRCFPLETNVSFALTINGFIGQDFHCFLWWSLYITLCYRLETSLSFKRNCNPV